MKNLFLSEIQKDIISSEALKVKDVFTENDIASLPAPVQKYFRYCGYMGKEKMHNMFSEWDNVYLKTAVDKDWMKIDCYQYNSVTGPTRLAYMKGSFIGILPFEGRDKYQDNHGNMLIKLAKFITVGDSKGHEMDESALVTLLAETLFMPSYALQKNITWEEVDSLTAKANITVNSVTVGGVFHFNHNGELEKFTTEDRNFAKPDGGFEKIKWTAFTADYSEKNGFMFPSKLSAVWHFAKGDFAYFKGNIVDLKFNIKQIPSRLKNGKVTY